MEEVAQPGLTSLDRAQFNANARLKFARILRGEIAESAVLEPAPERFDRVEHGRVGGQAFKRQASGAFSEQRSNGLAFVHHAAIPEHDQALAREFGEQRFQEVRHAHVVEVAVEECLIKQAQPIPPGREPERGAKRNLLAVDAALQERGRLALGRPGAPQERGHQKPALVDEDKARSLPAGFFLILGQSRSSQRAMACGSRSRGTRAGRWGVNPRARSHALR